MNNRHALISEIQYFPPVSYFRLFLEFETLYIEKYENYQKKSYRNRCEIAGPHGRQTLSVPLTKGKNQQTPISEVAISNNYNWQMKHWHALEAAYRKSPYFEFYELELKPFFSDPFEHLFDLDVAILRKLLEITEINIKIDFTMDFKTAPINALDATEWLKPGINRWIKSEDFPEYRQVFSEEIGFLSDLSILDLIFNKGPETILYLKEIPQPEFN